MFGEILCCKLRLLPRSIIHTAWSQYSLAPRISSKPASLVVNLLINSLFNCLIFCIFNHMTHSIKIKVIAITFVTLSAIGFLDATYLTMEHYRGSVPPCAIAGCEIVLKSGQSAIFGVPVALFGVIYYLTILILSIAYLESGKIAILRLASYLTIIGVIASAYFVYLQLFVIGQICQYCMVSASTSTGLFGMGMYTLKN